MTGSRVKRIAIVAAAGAVATAAVLALNPFSASADPAQATTTTLTAPSSVATGHSLTITATVDPAKVGSTKATGTVTFTITGSDSSTVDCTGGDAPTLNGKGKAVCKVASGLLDASASPYSVTGDYSGDGTFIASTGELSQSVGSASSHLRVTFDAKPSSGSPTTFTATVLGGSGALPTGNVLFSVVASDGKPKKANCPGGNLQALSPSADPVPVAQATCALPANWFKVAAASKKNPHPSSTWTVHATYGGDDNYGTSNAAKHGSAKA